MEDFDEKLAVAFLNDLEASRKNSARTRNNRLAALRAFFRYVAAQEPMLLARCQRICEIPTKRAEHKVIEYLEDQEIRALLESIGVDSPKGRRDYALLLFFYNTGARVQEAVDLKLVNLRLDTPCHVKLVGKGRKECLCPLWPETVTALQDYLNVRGLDATDAPSVFLNASGRPITRFGIRYLLRHLPSRRQEIVLH